jgi:hypothetical protein
VLDILDSAKKSIYVEERTFDPFLSRKLSASLIEASKRGVDVRILVERTYSGDLCRQHLAALSIYGIKVRMEEFPDRYGGRGSIIIVDNSTVVLSDYNPETYGAGVGAGLLIQGKDIPAHFAEKFFEDWSDKIERQGKDYKSKICLSFILLWTGMLILRRWRYV